MTEQPPPASPPPSTPPPASSGGGTGGTAGNPFAHAHKYDLGMIGAGLLAFIASLLPFYTFSASASGFESSASVNAWHGFFGWFGVLLAVTGAVLVLLGLLNVRVPFPTRTAALACFAAAVVSLLLALVVMPGGGFDSEGPGFKSSSGHGIGYWLALVAAIAGAALAFMRKDETA